MLRPLAVGFSVALSIALLNTLPAIVTSDDYGTHITTPGVSLFDLNHDGVAQVRNNGNFSCTGSLLKGGMHVLTAGHCVSNENIQEIVVRFELASGVVDIPAHSWRAHPDYPRIPGSDLGIITLTQRAPSEIPRYSPLLNVGDDLNTPNLVFGYGRTGYAVTGKDIRDGNKRGGRNRYEATGASGQIAQAKVGGDHSHRIVFSDFDSGLPENDGFGFHFDTPDLGFGDDEVYASNGDSGAPIFVHNGQTHVIAAAVSGGARFPGTPNSDTDALVNATWGQFSRDTRVSHPNNLAFIQGFTAGALEPFPLRIVSDSNGLAFDMTEQPDSTIYLQISHDLKRWQNGPTLKIDGSAAFVPIPFPISHTAHSTWFFEAQREPIAEPNLPETLSPAEP